MWVYIYKQEQEWQPWENTLLYMEFNDNLDDETGNNTMTGSWIDYEIIWNKKCVRLTSISGWISWPWNLMSSVGTWDFTTAFWFYPVGSSDWPVMFANAKSTSPRNWCQLFMCYDSRRWLNNQVSYHMTQTWHWSSMSATSLNNSWHHFVFTRINGICYWYIDWQEAFTSWSDNSTLSDVNSLYILNRADQSDQQRDSAWVKMSELIVEKQWWTAEEITAYYNLTKSNYGL